jgi:DNA-binding NarL/FixJ family response regulator
METSLQYLFQSIAQAQAESELRLHLSTRLATLRSQSMDSPILNCDRLTPREAQIAKLVAQGLTSTEIGAALWITENTVARF